MTVPQRTLLVAVIVAMIVGFAAGWYARIYRQPTVESRAQDAARSIRERVNELVK